MRFRLLECSLIAEHVCCTLTAASEPSSRHHWSRQRSGGGYSNLVMADACVCLGAATHRVLHPQSSRLCVLGNYSSPSLCCGGTRQLHVGRSRRRAMARSVHVVLDMCLHVSATTVLPAWRQRYVSRSAGSGECTIGATKDLHHGGSMGWAAFASAAHQATRSSSSPQGMPVSMVKVRHKQPGKVTPAPLQSTMI